MGVSGGEVMGMEKTQGYTLCSKNAPQKMIVVAEVQGRGFCKLEKDQTSSFPRS